MPGRRAEPERQLRHCRSAEASKRATMPVCHHPMALKVIPEMHPQVRSYIDAVAGLEAQLAELIGLARIVPPLVEADRRR